MPFLTQKIPTKTTRRAQKKAQKKGISPHISGPLPIMHNKSPILEHITHHTPTKPPFPVHIQFT
jgi:hypothetical protein